MSNSQIDCLGADQFPIAQADIPSVPLRVEGAKGPTLTIQVFITQRVKQDSVPCPGCPARGVGVLTY